MRVLIVEDSRVLRDSIAQGLREGGYAIDAAADGKQGLQLAERGDYDVIILDWMMPEPDGLAVLARLREQGIDSAILMLTARDAVDDRVTGLRRGADDYLVKPFAFAELLARVQALARRRHAIGSPIMSIGPLSLESAARVVTVRGTAVDLTPREFAVLEYLALRKGKPVPRLELEDHVYDARSQVFSNAIDSAVCSLRAKLEAAGCPPMIRTRRKIGYVLEDPGAPRQERRR